MPTMLQATIRTNDGIAENFVTNQFCVDDIPANTVTWDAMTAAIKSFYDAISGTCYPNTIAQNGHVLKFYALPGLVPNYPYHEDTFDLAAAPNGITLPAEVALCLSFQGTRNAGFPQARRRGRVYIGPLESGILGTTGRPGATVQGVLLDAAEGLWDDLEAALPGEGWSVWSPTDGTAVLIDNAWVDDAWDTVRSRGLDPSARVTRQLAP